MPALSWETFGKGYDQWIYVGNKAFYDSDGHEISEESDYDDVDEANANGETALQLWLSKGDAGLKRECLQQDVKQVDPRSEIVTTETIHEKRQERRVSNPIPAVQTLPDQESNTANVDEEADGEENANRKNVSSPHLLLAMNSEREQPEQRNVSDAMRQWKRSYRSLNPNALQDTSKFYEAFRYLKTMRGVLSQFAYQPTGDKWQALHDTCFGRFIVKDAKSTSEARFWLIKEIVMVALSVEQIEKLLSPDQGRKEPTRKENEAKDEKPKKKKKRRRRPLRKKRQGGHRSEAHLEDIAGLEGIRPNPSNLSPSRQMLTPSP
ncbi:MAG: hypothetical protein Q9227_000391 [Pyrenula ochraceoflavens]